MAIAKEGEYQDFSYTGSVQSFVSPFEGLYQLEAWGAQGGSKNDGIGGFGGYSKGYIILTEGASIYICVGGVGSYNGGGTGVGYNQGGDGTYLWSTSGGGATHISTTNRGELKQYSSYKSEILMVAGGGGGSGKDYNSRGGEGGGLNGYSGYCNNIHGTWENGASSNGASQTAVGGNGNVDGGYYTGSGFGQGASAVVDDNTWDHLPSTGAGGGGWYGGGGGNVNQGGGGGSGYIGGVPEIVYKGTTYSPSTSNGARSGNGLARITLIQKAMPATLYLGGLELTGIFVGNNEIKSAFLGDKDLG